MRLFLAFTPAPHITDQLYQAQRSIKDPSHSLRWISKQNLHLTVLFLGNISPHKLSLLKQKLQEITPLVKTPVFKFNALKLFPTNHKPRLLMVDLVDLTKDRYLSLQRHLYKSLSKSEFSLKKPKPPHITLARIKSQSQSHSQINIDLTKISLNLTNWKVDALDLYQSHLQPSGATYLKIGSYPLD